MSSKANFAVFRAASAATDTMRAVVRDRVDEDLRTVQLDESTPVANMKSIKNPTEIRNMRHCHLLDSLALVNSRCDVHSGSTDAYSRWSCLHGFPKPSVVMTRTPK